MQTAVRDGDHCAGLTGGRKVQVADHGSWVSSDSRQCQHRSRRCRFLLSVPALVQSHCSNVVILHYLKSKQLQLWHRHHWYNTSALSQTPLVQHISLDTDTLFVLLPWIRPFLAKFKWTCVGQDRSWVNEATTKEWLNWNGGRQLQSRRLLVLDTFGRYLTPAIKEAVRKSHNTDTALILPNCNLSLFLGTNSLKTAL